MEKTVNKWLDNMPFDKRFKVNERQAELVKQWMQGKKYDGGINFSSDWGEIYKVDISDII